MPLMLKILGSRRKIPRTCFFQVRTFSSQETHPKTFWKLPDDRITTQHVKITIQELIKSLKIVYQEKKTLDATQQARAVEDMSLYYRTLLRYKKWLVPSGAPYEENKKEEGVQFLPYTYPGPGGGRFLSFVSDEESLKPYIEAQAPQPCYAALGFPIGILEGLVYVHASEEGGEVKPEQRVVGVSFNAKTDEEFLSVSFHEPAFSLTLTAQKLEMSLLRSAKSTIENRIDIWNQKDFIEIPFKNMKIYTRDLPDNSISFSGTPTGMHGNEITIYDTLKKAKEENRKIVLWYQRPETGPFEIPTNISKELLEKIDAK